MEPEALCHCAQIVLSGHLRMMGTGDPSKAVTGHVARELLKLAFEKSMSKDDNTPFAIAATEVSILTELTRPRLTG
jgi:hypothetical protein